MGIARTIHRSFWYKNKTGTTFSLSDVKNTGMGAITINSISGRTPVFRTNADGQRVRIFDTQDDPGGNDSAQIDFSELDNEVIYYLLKAKAQQGFFGQLRTYSCPPVNTTNWTINRVMEIVPTGGSLGGGPNLDGSDGTVDSNITVDIPYWIDIVKGSLSALTSGETVDILSLAGLRQLDSGDPTCGLQGYPGPDRIFIAGLAPDSAPAELIYSVNGGSSWAAFASDATPFAVNSGITHIVMEPISETQFRVIVGRATDASTPPQIAYGDYSVAGGAYTGSWTVVALNATNNQAVEAMVWDKENSRLYVAAAGDIYLSTDNGETIEATTLYTGSNAMAAAAKDPDGNIWFVGASDTILREVTSNRGTFTARTAPGSSAAFTAIAFGDDGTLFAAHGTTLYKSVNNAADSNGWTSLLAAGAGKAITGIAVKGGFSQCLRVIVDDTGGSTSDVRESEDGGNTWRTVTTLTNTGYNKLYNFVSDPNKALIAGDDGVIHYLA